MSSPDNIDRIAKQTQRYWYEDGFQDMAFGGFILAIGLLFLGQALTPQGSPLWLLWSVGMPLLLLCGGLVVNRVVKTLKERITFPRTGFVAYPQAQGRSRVMRLLAVMVVSAGVSSGVIIVQRNWLSMTVIIGLVYLLTFCWVGYRFGLWRYFGLAFLSLGLGLAIAGYPLSLEQSGAVYHVAIGGAWILAGWITWLKYNKSAPLPERQED